MWYLAVLVAFAVSTANGQPLPLSINCPPTLTSPNLIGSVTQTTFTSQDYYCCIAQTPGVSSTDNVVTVVGLSDVIRNLDPKTIDINNPPLYSNFSNIGYFAALNGRVGDLCTLAGAAGIRIGDNTICLINGNIPFCNGPLTLPGPYSVIVLVYRNGTLIGTTSVSSPIYLRNPKDYSSIDPSVKNHSGGMITITTILPILLALLMAVFSSMLLMNCCCCRVFTPTKCQQE